MTQDKLPIPSTRILLGLVLAALLGCQQRVPPPLPKDEMFDGHKIIYLDCKDKSNQVNLMLKDSQSITDCYTLLDALDKLMKPEVPHADE